MLAGAASPDADTLVVSGGDDGTLQAWELTTGVVVETFKGGGACGPRAVTPVRACASARCCCATKVAFPSPRLPPLSYSPLAVMTTEFPLRT